MVVMVLNITGNKYNRFLYILKYSEVATYHFRRGVSEVLPMEKGLLV